MTRIEILTCQTADITSRSRGAGARAMRGIHTLLKKQRAQGKPGARYTRGLVCNVRMEKTHTSIQVKRKQPGFPCAMVYDLYALPGDRAFLPPSPAGYLPPT